MQNNISRVHFIAIGGSVMHDLALHLHDKGLDVSGSDDEIYDPAKSALAAKGLLPEEFGWFPDKITTDLDAIILGMHARPDNPELKRARELGLQVYSYPDYIYEQSKDKQRIVIAGSHGKTTITSMILHVLQEMGREFDYVIGARTATVKGMVQLTDAPIIIIEGDEYLTSPVDSSPKFLKYKHHIGLISGIAWDHYNVFPTLDDYVKQFEMFADASPKGANLIYCEEDDLATVIGRKERPDVNRIEYHAHPHVVRNGQTYLQTDDGEVPVRVFGYHNMQNLSGALEVCKRIGILKEDFYQAVSSFSGASKRLELIAKNEHTAVYKDFAHAPSKLMATTRAVKQQFPKRQLIACMELHTFSSLNREFVNQYQDALNDADIGIVYHNPEVSRHKKLEPLDDAIIQEAFNRPDIKVFTKTQEMQAFLKNQSWADKNLLLMSSGNYGGMDLDAFGKSIVENKS